MHPAQARSNQTQVCPTCRAEVDGTQLRPNIALREAVQSYQAALPDILKHVRQPPAPPVAPADEQPQAGTSGKHPAAARHVAGSQAAGADGPRANGSLAPPQPRTTRRGSASTAAPAPGPTAAGQRRTRSTSQQAPHDEGAVIVLDHEGSDEGAAEDEGERQAGRGKQPIPRSARTTRARKRARKETGAGDEDDDDVVIEEPGDVQGGDEEEEEEAQSTDSDSDFDPESEVEEHEGGRRGACGGSGGSRKRRNSSTAGGNVASAAVASRRGAVPSSKSGTVPSARTSAPGARAAHLPPGFVACPVCSMSVRNELINSHLDTCIPRTALHPQPDKAAAKAAHPVRPPAPFFNRSSNGGGVGGGSSGSGGAVADVPPKLVFHVLKDKELKAKVAALGLPTDGKRQVGLIGAGVFHVFCVCRFACSFALLCHTRSTPCQQLSLHHTNALVQPSAQTALPLASYPSCSQPLSAPTLTSACSHIPSALCCCFLPPTLGVCASMPHALPCCMHSFHALIAPSPASSCHHLLCVTFLSTGARRPLHQLPHLCAVAAG